MGKVLSAAYAYIDEIRDETIARYKEFVNRESWSKTPDKVRIFSDFLKGEMEKAGFECRYVPVGVNADTPVSYTHLDVYKRQPLSGWYRPNRMLTKVDLPAPFSPKSA